MTLPRIRPRPGSLPETCGFNRSGRALVHRWAHAEFYAYRSCATGEPLRLALVRCKRCDAFQLTSMGGDREVLEELLSFAHPIAEYSGWCSPEQPSCADHAEMPPRRKRKVRRAA